MENPVINPCTSTDGSDTKEHKWEKDFSVNGSKTDVCINVRKIKLYL